MMMAAAFMKPRMTGCETKLTMVPSFKLPSPNWIKPTMKVNSSTRPMKLSVMGTASGATAAAVIKDTMATGPVANCRDEPHNAPKMAGIKAV